MGLWGGFGGDQQCALVAAGQIVTVQVEIAALNRKVDSLDTKLDCILTFLQEFKVAVADDIAQVKADLTGISTDLDALSQKITDLMNNQQDPDTIAALADLRTFADGIKSKADNLASPPAPASP